MKHLKLKNWVIWVSTMVLMGVTLFCKKSDNDNKGALALLLGSASFVPATGPGCDRTKKECVISLMAGKTWYMVGPQQPTHLLGFRPFVLASAGTCYAKTKADIQVGSGTNDLVFTVANVNGTTTNPDGTALTGDETCDHNTSVGGYGSNTTSDAATITPVSESCFNIDIIYTNFPPQEGRGTINRDGTELLLEVYVRNVAFAIDPSGHRCADGAVGERNASLTPDSTSCDNNNYVCNPASDPTYNNVQIYDLVE